MEQWIADYNSKCGANLNAYGGGGSGKGIADFIGNQVDFAGSDSALNADQATQAQSTRCANNPAINLPMVTGPIALAYNLSGVDKLILTPEVLAGIFDGSITNWNDPKIAAVNPGVTLPTLAIQAVHRAEDSGTTENFTKYLTAARRRRLDLAAGGKAWAAPGGVAAQGSDGVSKQIAEHRRLHRLRRVGLRPGRRASVAQIDNGGGAVELTAESAGKAVEAATVVGHRQGSGAQAGLRHQDPGCLPGGAGHLRDRLLRRQRRGHRPAAEVVPRLHGHRRSGHPGHLGAAPLPAAIQTKVIASVSTIS